MPVLCPIKIDCKTKILLKEQSLTFDFEGKPTETYDSIIRRAVEKINHKSKIDVSKL